MITSIATLFGAERVDAVRRRRGRVDVEAGIGLVEHAERRLEERHLQDLVALLLAAGEADVERTAEHFLSHLKLLGDFARASG